jgi:hypothetical protein
MGNSLCSLAMALPALLSNLQLIVCTHGMVSCPRARVLIRRIAPLLVLRWPILLLALLVSPILAVRLVLLLSLRVRLLPLLLQLMLWRIRFQLWLLQHVLLLLRPPWLRAVAFELVGPKRY